MKRETGKGKSLIFKKGKGNNDSANDSIMVLITNCVSLTENWKFALDEHNVVGVLSRPRI